MESYLSGNCDLSYSSCNRDLSYLSCNRTRQVIAIFRTCRPNCVPSLLHHSHPVRLHYLEEDPLALTKVKLTWKIMRQDSPRRTLIESFRWRPSELSLLDRVTSSHVRSVRRESFVHFSYICPHDKGQAKTRVTFISAILTYCVRQARHLASTLGGFE